MRLFDSRTAVLAAFLSTALAGCLGPSATTVTRSGRQPSLEIAPAPRYTPPPVSASGSITPAELLPMLGPLVMKKGVAPDPQLALYDERYLQYERQHYDEFLADPTNVGLIVSEANHYGALRSRLMWALRTGQPIGTFATDENQHIYARGRRIIQAYLQLYSEPANFSAPPHNNTAMADIEAYWTLEKDPLAWSHIHMVATYATYDSYGVLHLAPGSDTRMVVVPLQALMAAHRMKIPFVAAPKSSLFDSSEGSWKATARRNIGWLDQVIPADGTVFSPAHNAEAYLFSAWLATELLNYCAYIEMDARVMALAKRIVDHMIAVLPAGWDTLPYISTETSPAPDLAGFYIHPALVLWQETGDPKYRDFAMKNVKAANESTSIAYLKQWNQVFSTLGMGAEALLSGVSWK